MYITVCPEAKRVVYAVVPAAIRALYRDYRTRV